MSNTLQNKISRLVDINGQNDALINILVGYCENYIESPRPESLFDILVGLRRIKQNTVQIRKILEELE